MLKIISLFLMKNSMTLKSKDDFVECALVHNYQYGTLRSYINERIDKGINIILDIDVQGFEQIQEASIDNTSIFIIPPSIEELKNRLNIRGTRFSGCYRN